LNAETAVRLALPAQPPERVVITRTYNEAIADFQTSTVSLEVGESAALAGIKVQVDIDHTYIGDLVVTVIPPPQMGAASVALHNREGGNTDNLRRTYDAASAPGLNAYNGKSAKGTWKLEVRDEARADVGRIVRFGLELTFGAPAPPIPVRSRSARAAATTTTRRKRAKAKA
jgi:subtilisin-like proprotein convertase family protein